MSRVESLYAYKGHVLYLSGSLAMLSMCVYIYIYTRLHTQMHNCLCKYMHMYAYVCCLQVLAPVPSFVDSAKMDHALLISSCGDWGLADTGGCKML